MAGTETRWEGCTSQGQGGANASRFDEVVRGRSYSAVFATPGVREDPFRTGSLAAVPQSYPQRTGCRGAWVRFWQARSLQGEGPLPPTDPTDSSKQVTARIFTAHVRYMGMDRLQITRRQNRDLLGLLFAPSNEILSQMLEARRRSADDAEAMWDWYTERYLEEMIVSYDNHRDSWQRLLLLPEVTLCCFCHDASRCHRTLAAGFLGAIGGDVRGERGGRP